MAEPYLKGLGGSLIVVAAWVFTVGGAVASLAVGKEYSWIAGLVFLTGIIALVVHGRQVHHEHQKERDGLTARLNEEVRRREDAERKLAEVPAEALARLAALVAEGVVAEVVGNIQLNAILIGRLRGFVADLTRPLTVRTFQFIQGELYVVAKGPVAALARLRPGDPFRLIKRTDAGVEIAAARVVVHQPVAEKDELVRFRVIKALADDIQHLSGLAGERPVEGVKGYSLAIGIDLDAIPSFDGGHVADIIPHLARAADPAPGK